MKPDDCRALIVYASPDRLDWYTQPPEDRIGTHLEISWEKQAQKAAAARWGLSPSTHSQTPAMC